MSKSDPILIVGGGLGGLTTALALARRGRTVRVLEGAPEFGAIGYGIQFGPNVFHVFDRIGVSEAVLAVADSPVPQSWSVFHDCDPVNTTGVPFESLKYGEFAETASGFLILGFDCPSLHGARQHTRTSNGIGFHQRCGMRPLRRGKSKAD